MGTFTAIPQDTFDGLEMNAGLLLKKLSLDASKGISFVESDIICATTGDIKIVCEPTFTDLGSDINNCPSNMKELKILDSWKCEMTFTSVGTTGEHLRFALGCADKSTFNTGDSYEVEPRASLDQDKDFADLWWVGDRADGGCVAVKISNALSTAGLSLTTARQSKGKLAITLTAHFSIKDQTTVPMTFYSASPKAVTGSSTSTS